MKKCGRCAKPAVLHITEIRHGEVQALHLCESCAKEYLNESEAGGPPPDDDDVGGPSEESESSDTSDDELSSTCPQCGITFKEFRKQGRLGCPHDYTVFHDELMPLLENIHGETQHTGKVPKRAPKASQHQFRLIRLRNRLRAAVDEEMYEEAARLRDEIQSLENEAGSSGNAS
ncbi:MAG: UvrB/UvrC motif-containing protein [Planctomycetaceae bacterium]|nr:UvrB/UvrC motif-containing protein [Planctomycetaceae bacterium]